MEYNIETTKIFFADADEYISVCSPTGDLPVEVVATRDLPKGFEYWIVDFETKENLQQAFSDVDFFGALEIDKEILGPPHGVSLGYEEWVKLQEAGTLGVGSN
jgi:hypothetical protein